jgi:hypothetical protein
MRSEEPGKCDRDEAGGVEPLVQRKVHLLRKYLSITEELKACLNENRTEPLHSLLVRRQKCADDVERTDSLLRRAVRQRCGGGPNPSAEVHGLLDSHFSQLRGILASIEVLDRELIGRLKEESEEIKGELLKTRTARSATEKYRGRSAQTPRFLDVSR